MSNLHWWQDQAIDNPSLWMAEDGDYSLSVYYDKRNGWCFKIWQGTASRLVMYGKHQGERELAMLVAETEMNSDRLRRVDE